VKNLKNSGFTLVELATIDTYNWDIKTDDGIPQTGNVLAFGQSGATSTYALTATGVNCYMAFNTGL
jgi:hypothetical protein